MEELQKVIQKVEADLQEGRSEGEVLHHLLSFVGEDLNKSEQAIEALGKMGHPQAGRLLRRWSEATPDKKIQKMIKRSIYRLKSKGIAVEEPSLKGERPIFRLPPSEPPVGFGGPFDSLGQRFLLLSVPRPGRGILVVQGLLSDTEGWIDCSVGEMGRKHFKELLEKIQKSLPFPLVEMEASYVAFLFDEAYRLSLHQGKTPPQDYLERRREVEAVKKTYSRPIIYSLLPEEEIEREEGIFEKGAELHQIDLFSSWILNEEVTQPYVEEVRMAEESRLVLQPFQKEARLHEIYQRALSEIFSDEVRSRYRNRMEEMAYYLFQAGKREEAKLSLSVALSLKRPFNPIRPNPFLFHLVVKSILTYLSERQKREREFSLITRP
ncbi:MAG: hypothetical protein N3G78_04830 [Desulfobacterota bacterium]|nr:hypothetical protein [Thermodesulfobacteriota bacterium]